MTDPLGEELDRIVGARDRAGMAPTIAALLPILDAHPRNARVLYEVGGAYDTAGEEATALDLYERAEAAGLAGDVLRRCYLQHGSTLRNLGRVDESIALFARARAQFPGSSSLAVFEALTLHAAGRADAALAGILLLVADRVPDEELQRYLPAIRGNAEHIASRDAPPAASAG